MMKKLDNGSLLRPAIRIAVAQHDMNRVESLCDYAARRKFGAIRLAWS